MKNEIRRVTVTLEEGDRRRLEEIAKRNRVKLAFVVRFAVSEFLANPKRGKALLDLNTSSGNTHGSGDNDW